MLTKELIFFFSFTVILTLLRMLKKGWKMFQFVPFFKIEYIESMLNFRVRVGVKAASQYGYGLVSGSTKMKRIRLRLCNTVKRSYDSVGTPLKLRAYSPWERSCRI
jgi:hypothetical protein